MLLLLLVVVVVYIFVIFAPSGINELIQMDEKDNRIFF